jgi:O-6-methylguanine DNA methyltransferase
MKTIGQSFKEKVYAVVAKIPKGSVLTYQEVARRAGNKAASRAVGNIMHNNPDTKKVPCHRVVRSDGAVGGYAWGTAKKAAILKREGVKFSKAGKIVV